MIVQIININSKNVFELYNKKYNIFKNLRERGYFGLEIRDISEDIAAELHKYFLKNEIFSYIKKKQSISIFILGTFEQIIEVSNGIKSNIGENVGHKITSVINNYLNYSSNKIPFVGSPNLLVQVMGILNVTPDSFSDGGLYFTKEKALEHINLMVDNGVDMIDIGGESSRPGAKNISVDEEIKRVIPVIESAKKVPIPISIDTTKSEVAEEALKNGVKIINDISGLTFDDKMMDVILKHNAGCVIMHMKGKPDNMQDNPEYEDVITEVYDFLYKQSEVASKRGIKNIIIDPGIGFGKSVRDNFNLINRLDEFKGLGYPILIGVSRKSLIGKSLQLNINEREIPTVILETLAINKGAKIIRTHNVQNAVHARKLFSFVEMPDSVI
ncbi:MAG: hypothetical protein Fur0015_02910 [Ignavibacteriales bacterium]